MKNFLPFLALFIGWTASAATLPEPLIVFNTIAGLTNYPAKFAGQSVGLIGYDTNRPFPLVAVTYNPNGSTNTPKLGSSVWPYKTGGTWEFEVTDGHDPRWAGAYGDGTHADDVAIQRTYDAAAADAHPTDAYINRAGAVVKFLPGRYLITNTINLPPLASTTRAPGGPEDTKLVTANQIVMLKVTSPAQQHFHTIDGLGFVGVDHATVGAAFENTGPSITVRIKNFRIAGGFRGLHLVSCEGGSITDGEISNIQGNCIFLDNDGVNSHVELTISGVSASSYADYSYYFTKCAGLTCYGLKGNSSWGGFKILSVYASTFIDCAIEAFYDHAVYLPAGGDGFNANSWIGGHLRAGNATGNPALPPNSGTNTIWQWDASSYAVEVARTQFQNGGSGNIYAIDALTGQPNSSTLNQVTYSTGINDERVRGEARFLVIHSQTGSILDFPITPGTVPAMRFNNAVRPLNPPAMSLSFPGDSGISSGFPEWYNRTQAGSVGGHWWNMRGSRYTNDLSTSGTLVVYGNSSSIQHFSQDLSGTVTLVLTNKLDNDSAFPINPSSEFTVVRTGAGAFNISVEGATNGTVVLAAGTKIEPTWAKFVFAGGQTNGISRGPTNWVMQSRSSTSGGSVTSVSGSGGTSGLTLSGGPITGTGTLTIGGTLAIANGGTASTSASAARTALGLALGSDIQGWDLDLQRLATVSWTTGDIPYRDSIGLTNLATTAAGRTLLQAADASAQRTALTLVPGTDIQAFSANLATLASVGYSGSSGAILRTEGPTINNGVFTGTSAFSTMTVGILSVTTNFFIPSIAYSVAYDGGTNGVAQNALYDQLHIADTDDDGLDNKVDLASAGYVRTDSGGVLSVGTTSAHLAADISDEIGTAGKVMFGTHPGANGYVLLSTNTPSGGLIFGALPIGSGATMDSVAVTNFGSSSTITGTVATGTATLTTLLPALTIVTNSGVTTYTVPAGARFLRVEAWGAGGSGASGRRGASLSQRCGGGGGAGGSYSLLVIPIAALAGTTSISVTNGAGGVGGGGCTTDDHDGTNGVAGGLTSFGAYVMASGGGGGVQGTAGSGLPGVVGNTYYTTIGGGGGTASASGTTGGQGTDVLGSSTYVQLVSAAGGGAGGGLSTVDATSAGGRGGGGPPVVGGVRASNGLGTGGAGGGTAGNPGGNIHSAFLVGGGGAGGGGSATASGSGAGGKGGNYGAGGGGGGAVQNGNLGGSGGAGADGAISILAY